MKNDKNLHRLTIDIDIKKYKLFKSVCALANKTMRDVIQDYINRETSDINSQKDIKNEEDSGKKIL